MAGALWGTGWGGGGHWAVPLKGIYSFALSPSVTLLSLGCHEVRTLVLHDALAYHSPGTTASSHLRARLSEAVNHVHFLPEVAFL